MAKRKKEKMVLVALSVKKLLLILIEKTDKNDVVVIESMGDNTYKVNIN